MKNEREDDSMKNDKRNSESDYYLLFWLCSLLFLVDFEFHIFREFNDETLNPIRCGCTTSILNWIGFHEELQIKVCCIVYSYF